VRRNIFAELPAHPTKTLGALNSTLTAVEVTTTRSTIIAGALGKSENDPGRTHDRFDSQESLDLRTVGERRSAADNRSMATVIVLIYLVVIVAVGFAAKGYGRRPWPWVVLALFIGLFAFIPLLIAGRPRSRRGVLRAR
jgi:hypothetical protein